MVTFDKPSPKLLHMFTLVSLLLFFIPTITDSQTSTPHLKLSKKALEFYHSGLDSGNYGVKKSLVYYAGKYRIEGVSEHLVDLLKKNIENEALCEMLVWSIYQIGDNSCCQELKRMMEIHPLKKVREEIKFFNIIKEYENALIVNRG